MAKTKMPTGGRDQMGKSKQNTQNYDNSINTQCNRLLDWLQNGEHLSTYECRARGIMHPAGRVNNLRNQGYNIITQRTWQEDANKVKHLFAKYILISLNHGGVI